MEYLTTIRFYAGTGAKAQKRSKLLDLITLR